MVVEQGSDLHALAGEDISMVVEAQDDAGLRALSEVSWPAWWDARPQTSWECDDLDFARVEAALRGPWLTVTAGMGDLACHWLEDDIASTLIGDVGRGRFTTKALPIGICYTEEGAKLLPDRLKERLKVDMAVIGHPLYP